MSSAPTTTASSPWYSSSIRRGWVSYSSDASPPNLPWYQTFHSSKDSRSFFLLRSRAPTESAVAITVSIIRSMSTPLARKLAVSPSSSW